MKSKDKESAITLLERFSLTTLLQKNWEDASKYPAFEHFDRFVQHARQEPQVREQLLAHAAYEIGAAYQQAKERDLYDSKMQFCASSFRKILFRHV